MIRMLFIIAEVFALALVIARLTGALHVPGWVIAVAFLVPPLAVLGWFFLFMLTTDFSK